MILSNIEEQALWRRTPGILRLVCNSRVPPSNVFFCLALLSVLMLWKGNVVQVLSKTGCLQYRKYFISLSIDLLMDSLQSFR